jgi:hypothetical protein
MPATVAPLVLVCPTRLPAIRLNADAAAPASSWIQVAVVGDYEDSRYGEFSITTEMLNAMVLNFASGKFPTPPTEICVDYDHLTTKAAQNPGDGKAAAWFKELQTRDDGTTLWARVEWTPAGAEAVATGEYKFFSPYFSTNYETNTGEEIGPCLINGAITNRPFLQGMQPLSLALSVNAGKGPRPAQMFVALATLTDNDKRARLETAIQQRFGTWRDDYYGWDAWLVDTIEGAEAVYCVRRSYGVNCGYFIVGYSFGEDGSVTFTSDPEEVVNNWARLSAGTGGNALMAKIALTAANGTKVEIDSEQLEQLPLVKELRAKVPAPDAKVLSAAEFTAMDAQLKTLSSSVESLKTESTTNKEAAEKANKALARNEAEAKVGVLIAAGKVTPVQKDTYVELALGNPEMFEKLTKDMPVVVKLDTVAGSGGASVDASEKDAQLKALTAEIRAANPKLSAEQAARQALEQRPDLYEG